MFKEAKYLSLLAVCCIWLFGPGLFHDQVPSFRDTFHFYYPQAVWLDACAQADNYFPQWNSGEGLGASVNGQGSAAIYYPLRVVWLMPWLGLPTRLSLYIVLHLLIAASGIRFACRELGLSRRAGWLAGFSFCLSCPVYFQHTNLIFLTSAAWIGFAFAAITRILVAQRSFTRRQLEGCLLLGGCGTLMFLGGDPHTSLNAFLIAAVATLVASLGSLLSLAGYLLSRTGYLGLAADCSPGGHGTPPTNLRQIVGTASSRSFWIASALSICIACTAIQWIPIMRWTQHSPRVAKSGVLSQIGNLLEPQAQDASRRRLADAPPNHRIYDFSISPWHLATCLIPAAGGSYSPNNSRVFDALPAEGRMWIPSLYFGTLPLLFCLAAFGQPRMRKVGPWLGVTLFALLASLGNYSVVWLLREISRAVGANDLADALPADPVTSLYWVIAHIVPGYDSFRYPAKWSVWFAAGAAITAGLVYNSLLLPQAPNSKTSADEPPRKMDRLWLSCMLLSGSCLASAGILAAVLYLDFNGLASYLNNELIRRANDPWLGYPTSVAFANTLLLSSCIPLVCLTLFQQLRRRDGLRWLPWLVLVELSIASCQWTSFCEPPVVFAPIAKTEVFLWSNPARANAVADGYFHATDSQAAELALYQTQFALGKLAATADKRNLAASQSVTPQSIANLCGKLARRDSLLPEQPNLDALLRPLGVTHRLVRQRPPDQPARFRWQVIPNPTPLCSLTQSLVARPGQGGEPEPTRAPRPIEPTVQDSVLTWHWASTDQLLISVRCSRPSQLVVRQFSDGGWQCTAHASSTLDAPTDIPDGSSGRRLTVSTEKNEFIGIEIPPGVWQLDLSRKFLW